MGPVLGEGVLGQDGEGELDRAGGHRAAVVSNVTGASGTREIRLTLFSGTEPELVSMLRGGAISQSELCQGRWRVETAWGPNQPPVP